MQLLGSVNDIHEIAYSLLEQYTEYAKISDDLPLIEQDWLVEKIKKYLDTADLELMLENDYTRGLAMGQLLNIYFAEKANSDSAIDVEDSDG